MAIVLCSIFVAPNNMGLCIALMLLFGFALNYAITAVQPLMPESYPTAIRNTGTSWCQAFARFGGSASSIVLGGIAGMALFQTATGATNWSMVVLVLIVPFALGFVCTRAVREGNGWQDHGPACGRRGEAGQFRDATATCASSSCW